MIGIYKITNSINNKVYIGQSVNIAQRWKAHRTRPYQIHCEQYEHPLYRAIRKYGLDQFTFEVIEECKPEELNEKEIAWIQFYDATNNLKGYNLSSGGYEAIPQKINQGIAQQIITLLKNTELTQKEIASQYDISQRLVSGINIGQFWIQPNQTYPIRHSIQNKQTPTCPNCGMKVSEKGNYCINCSNLRLRKVERPSRQELKMLIRNTPFVQIGKFYQVSDNTIRKWCDFYNLPRKASDIKKIDNETWELI